MQGVCQDYKARKKQVYGICKMLNGKEKLPEKYSLYGLEAIGLGISPYSFSGFSQLDFAKCKFIA